VGLLQQILEGRSKNPNPLTHRGFMAKI